MRSVWRGFTWRRDLEVLDLRDIGPPRPGVKGRHQGREHLLQDVIVLPALVGGSLILLGWRYKDRVKESESSMP